MNIILLFEKDSHGDGRYILTDHRATHIRTVLQLNRGDTINFGIVNGHRGTATIESIDDDEIILKLSSLEEGKTEKYTIDIICALPRPQTVKKILFICGMMAVRQLYLIRANRVEKSYYHSPLLDDENMNEHLYEGMMQGKNTRLPEVSISDKFKPFFEDTLPNFYKEKNESPMLLLPHIESDKNLTDASMSLSNADHYVFAIGPEGGWVDFELEMMENQGFHRFKLSDHTLRVEHALMACLSQLEIV